MYYLSNMTTYNNLSEQILEFAIENGLKIAYSDNPLPDINAIHDDLPSKYDLTDELYEGGFQKITEIFSDFAKIQNYITTCENDNLAHLKQNKANEINAQRDLAIDGGVSYNGKIYQSAKIDRDLLVATCTLYAAVGGLPEGFKWIAKDNSLNDFTLTQLFELGAAMGTNVNLNMIKARNIKDKIENATDAETIKAIKYE